VIRIILPLSANRPSVSRPSEFLS